MTFFKWLDNLCFQSSGGTAGRRELLYPEHPQETLIASSTIENALSKRNIIDRKNNLSSDLSEKNTYI